MRGITPASEERRFLDSDRLTLPLAIPLIFAGIRTAVIRAEEGRDWPNDAESLA